jgi:hypothetical protein
MTTIEIQQQSHADKHSSAHTSILDKNTATSSYVIHEDHSPVESNDVISYTNAEDLQNTSSPKIASSATHPRPSAAVKRIPKVRIYCSIQDYGKYREFFFSLTFIICTAVFYVLIFLYREKENGKWKMEEGN